MMTLQTESVLTSAQSIGVSLDRLSYFLMGAIVGFVIGTVGLWAIRYAIICFKDRRAQKKEAVFMLGRNLGKSPDPKLISFDDE